MSKRARTLLAIVVVELFLANTWLVLARKGVAVIGVWIGLTWTDRVEPQFQATLGQTMGSAMGAFLGLGLIAFFIAAKRDREG